MKTAISLLVFGVFLFNTSCDTVEDSQIVASEDPFRFKFKGQVVFERNVTTRVLYSYANPSAYQSNEIVIQALDYDLSRTLMLTFVPQATGEVELNEEMTGVWSLSLCLPTQRYLLIDHPANQFHIDGYNAERGDLGATFTLLFRNENPPFDTLRYDDAFLGTAIGSEPFEYCIEG